MLGSRRTVSANPWTGMLDNGMRRWLGCWKTEEQAGRSRQDGVPAFGTAAVTAAAQGIRHAVGDSKTVAEAGEKQKKDDAVGDSKTVAEAGEKQKKDDTVGEAAGRSTRWQKQGRSRRGWHGCTVAAGCLWASSNWEQQPGAAIGGDTAKRWHGPSTRRHDQDGMAGQRRKLDWPRKDAASSGTGSGTLRHAAARARMGETGMAHTQRPSEILGYPKKETVQLGGCKTMAKGGRWLLHPVLRGQANFTRWSNMEDGRCIRCPVGKLISRDGQIGKMANARLGTRESADGRGVFLLFI